MSYYDRQNQQRMDNRTSWRDGKQNGQQRWPIDLVLTGDERPGSIAGGKDGKDVAVFNESIIAWGNRVNAELMQSAGNHISKDVRLSASLKLNYTHFAKPVRPGEEITSIGFSFRPEGIYVHLGVGRGYNMEGSTRVITKKHDKEDRRPPRPWFNPVIERNLPDLQRIVQDYCKDWIINASRLFINQ